MATAAPNPLVSGDTAYLYRAAIGERSQDYYLRHFARFDGEGKAGTSWNWAAYWTTFNWLVYRRMWGWALAYVAALIGLALLVFGVGKLVLNYSDTSAILLSLLLLTAAFVVPGLYANAWFYTHCNEKITAALNKAPEIKEAAALLAADAPQSRRLWVLALGNAAVLALALSALNWFQTSESALPQLAREQSGTLQPATTPAAMPAPTPAASPVVAASTPPAEPAPPLDQASPAPVEPAAPATAATTPPAAPEPTPPVAAANRPAAPPVSSPAMMPAADRPARVEAAATAPEPAAAPAPVTQTPAAATPPRPATAARKPAPQPQRYVWVVQVGAYAQEENARKALSQVQSLGLEAGAETFGSQPLTRVRVGPFTSQAEADRAALRIKSLDLPALVIRQRP
jgi:cell division protein FtsN|uniref:SPOR domain-containing protein n=1 Tax=Hylemonella sp. TaxID=2066020 RepID=UPI0035B0966E